MTKRRFWTMTRAFDLLWACCVVVFLECDSKFPNHTYRNSEFEFCIEQKTLCYSIPWTVIANFRFHKDYFPKMICPTSFCFSKLIPMDNFLSTNSRKSKSERANKLHFDQEQIFKSQRKISLIRGAGLRIPVFRWRTNDLSSIIMFKNRLTWSRLDDSCDCYPRYQYRSQWNRYITAWKSLTSRHEPHEIMSKYFWYLFTKISTFWKNFFESWGSVRSSRMTVQDIDIMTLLNCCWYDPPERKIKKSIILELIFQYWRELDSIESEVIFFLMEIYVSIRTNRARYDTAIDSKFFFWSIREKTKVILLSRLKFYRDGLRLVFCDRLVQYNLRWTDYIWLRNVAFFFRFILYFNVIW